MLQKIKKEASSKYKEYFNEKYFTQLFPKGIERDYMNFLNNYITKAYEAGKDSILENPETTKIVLQGHAKTANNARKEILTKLIDETEKLRRVVMPTHAEENGYGCALNDILEIINKLKR